MRRWLIILAGLAAAVALFLVLRPDQEPEPSPSPTPTSTTATSITTPETPLSPTAGADALEIEAEVEEGRVGLEVEGQRVTGPRRVAVQAGTRVEIEVKSDKTDEVHVHGYDLKADVRPDQRARIRFVADLTGSWEVELEEAGLLLFRLEVSP